MVHRRRPPPSPSDDADARSARSWSVKERVLLGVGGSALALGVTVAIFWTYLLTLVVHSELALSPRSTSFRVWRSTPVPLSIDFYFWNWTNPHEIEDPDKRPHLEQMGPYRFKETKEKVNITWNDHNSTVSFRQLRRWYFDAENSNGSLADNVTTVNAVGLTAAYVVRDWNYLIRRSVGLALSTTNQRLDITRTVSQFLFEGFEDPLITIASRVPGLSGLEIPDFDKFGWFYMRNGSTSFDGYFNMDTGAADIGHLGELRRWNYNNFTPFYEGACGELRGSAGEFWPPGRSASDRVSLFAPDLCRSVSLDYAGPALAKGVAGLRFEGGPRMLDNGELDPANTCFCGGAGGDCVPGGVANVSACRYGAPAFVSFPHFYLADPSYRAAVSGMRPDADKHSFYIALEPAYSIPLDVAARFQINLLVHRDPDINMLAKVPERLMFPVIWFEQRAGITEELAMPLRVLLQLPPLLLAAAAGLALAGLGCLVAAPLLRRHRRRRRSNTLALVAAVVAKGAASDAAKGPRSKSVEADSVCKAEQAEQPLLQAASPASSHFSSASPASPVVVGARAPVSPPEDSRLTPEAGRRTSKEDDGHRHCGQRPSPPPLPPSSEAQRGTVTQGGPQD